MIISFFTLFLRDEIDFVRRLNFIFILRLVWASALMCFSLWFSLRSLLSSFSCLSSIDCRFDFRGITISHYFFSIFDEESFFDTYQTKNQSKEFVRKDYIEYYEKFVQINQTNDILEELNSDEDEWVKKSVRKKIMKMSETIRQKTIRVNNSIQNVDQSIEDDHDSLTIFKRNSFYETFELINIIIF
jgi:hypothetical protein